jgi:hypothetical protein
MSWSAKQYVAFEDERTRPVRDLLNAISETQARSVVDLGCGPGNSTEVLAARFPGATVTRAGRRLGEIPVLQRLKDARLTALPCRRRRLYVGFATFYQKVQNGPVPHANTKVGHARGGPSAKREMQGGAQNAETRNGRGLTAGEE